MRTSSVLAVAVLTFTAVVSTVPAHAATTRLEAESAALAGGAVVETDHPGYSGSGFVGGFTDGHRGTARTTFAVSAASAGSYTLALGYANGTGSSRTLTLTVDSTAQQISLPATASWDSWGSASVAVSLGAGAHSVSYTFGSGDSGNVNLDRLDVTPSATGQAGPLFEAENATLSGGAVVATDHPGYSGSGFVGGYTDGNKGNARTSFAVKVTTAGPQSLALRYANGTGTAMTLSLYVDSVRQRQVSLPASANWDTWTSATESVTLAAGDHTVAYAFDSTDSGNVNLDSLTVTTSVPAGPGEAEAAFLSGGATVGATTAGYTGPGYVTGFATTGARLVRTFAMASAGTATATIRFSGAGALAVSANGRDAGSASLPTGTGWRTATVSVPVRAGVNTLQLAGTGSDVQVDSVVVANETALAARGATTPYTEYEAEAETTTGTVLAADRTFHTVQAESSGRRAVRLGATGQSVSFTLTKPANAVTLRFSIPDTADGAGQTAPLALYANGTKIRDLSLTSNYSWVYGAYPYTNVPSQGSPHRFYDETRALIGDWPAGTVLKLQKDASSTAAYYDVDLLDAEQAPAAATAPAGALSITSYGAVPDNGSDATSAINAAIAAGASQNKPVWIPAGTFRITSKINVANVRVYGTGPWSSVIQGTGPRGGFFGTGSNVTLADFAIFGDVRVRDDNGSDGALDGNFGTGSLIQNLWIEHTKVGLWADSGTNGLYVVGTRIRDTFADGVNIHAKDAGTSNVRVDQSMVRNTGDDGLAMFSEGNTVAGSAYTFNTVQSPALANGIGVFGGSGNRVEDNVVSDNVEAGSGITVGTRFNPVPLSGTTSIRRNTLLRTGSFEHNWNSAIGGLWIYADSADIASPIVVEDLTLTDSSYQGVLLSYQKSITQLSFDRVTIAGAGTYGLETNATGSAAIAHTTVTGATSGGLLNDGGYTLVRGAGNSGF
ncbi:carbohydrate-binding protein [Amycolatopsis sp. RTGN1]|uniref:carbohydrate-binding protein n=1 Tax=Amycolatopsis ponsaeliensis TaxID=2992142 RepID=UPI00254DE7A9|nr:CBM35 domain-containing protein [Amycolatopsis sp. RTGN1]